MKIKFGVEKYINNYSDEYLSGWILYPKFPKKLFKVIDEGETCTSAIIGYKKYKNNSWFISITIPLCFVSIWLKLGVIRKDKKIYQKQTKKDLFTLAKASQKTLDKECIHILVNKK